MRIFISERRWEYNEKNVREQGTDKKFVLTQPKQLFNEDCYTVRRAIACENVPVDVAPEKDFYVYEFSYMKTGSCLKIVIVDEVTAKELIGTRTTEFLRGTANTYINSFFDERLGR